jgi:hypothetical protein
MTTEKPAPGGADFSGTSNESRRPEAAAPGTEHQERKSVILASTRSDCIRMMIRLVGEGGLQSLLKSQQPALGDRTAAELLQHDPMELARRLKLLDAKTDDFDEELVGDPNIEHFGRRRRESQVNRVLAILDELERSGHE